MRIKTHPRMVRAEPRLRWLGLAVAVVLVALGAATASGQPARRGGLALRHGQHRILPPRLLEAVAAAKRSAASGQASSSGAKSLGKGATLCVGGKPSCYSSLQAAFDAASDGATVKVARGTYAGGVTIAKSLTVVGAGAGATVIKGGGPVVTVGVYGASSEPTVAISGVTITGGLTTSSALSDAWAGADNVIALGGGIEVPPATDPNDPNNLLPGASLTVSDSVVTSNRAAPTATSAPQAGQAPYWPMCPNGYCPFASAKGGGIDTWGALTLRNTAVTNNEASGVASDADGGGINLWWTAALAMTGGSVSGNRALARVPNGRYAEGGGIFTEQGVSVNIQSSTVSGNTASLTNTLPFFVAGGNSIDMNANGGGIHVGDGSSVAITGTTFDGNTVVANDPNGEPYAFDAALHPGDAPLVLRDSSLTNNRLIVTAASSADVGPSGSTLDLYGPVTVSNTRITSNSTLVTSVNGTASAAGTVYSGDPQTTPALVTNSLIANNTVKAVSSSGPATILGVGVINEGLVTFRNTTIRNNVGTAGGTGGYARGGGIWNGLLGNPVSPVLTLLDSSVTGNGVTGSAGIQLQGGGIFATYPVTISNSSVKGNSPDQCYGC